MESDSYFTPEFFKFLKELRAHNEREWFERNKARYETAVRDPFLRLIAALGPPLRKINSDIVADPRPVGGSMMRIYRDMRFSRDKSPYKVSVAAHFSHQLGKRAPAPSYYLHFEPGNSRIGSGMWRPPPAALTQIRDAIVAGPRHWQRVTGNGEFRASCGMAGESLKRPPAGYDPDHPLIEDLKRKDFITSAPLSDEQVCAPDLLEKIASSFRATAPFMEFLGAAVGLR
jgi:uncharacterized protein (TIGR02453 family)